MRRYLPLLAFGLAFSVPASTQQYCTGTCQVTPSCSANATTTVTGTVFAPNGRDPLPNVTVYIAGDTVGPLTAGVSCPVPGAVPSGSPVAGAVTATDGTFTIINAPINPPGQPQALVMVSGKWRRIIPIDLSGGACTTTAADPTMTRFPQTQAEGDIPKIAVATGEADPVECVLYKVMGNNSKEFTNPGGGGRINFYLGEGRTASESGSYIGASGTTPSATTLTGDPNVLNSYDVLMLPCEGDDNTALRQSSNAKNGELANLVGFANAGGRVYASHYSYDWLDEAQTFPNVVNWTPNGASPANQNGIINTTFADGSTLAQWLTLPAINASTTPGQIPLQTLRHDFSTVNAPTQSWMALANGNVMQFTFDTPVGQTTGQCGRVLFNEYHVETSISNSSGAQFPGVCGSSTTMTAQEKLLEYMLFNLTSDGGDPTLTPGAADFGQQPIGFTSAAQNFTWTNHSIFSSAVTLLTASGDFSIIGGNPCTAVAPGASCTIPVVFTPTALGARTGVLTVGGGGKTLTASLTGIGIPGLTISPTSLTFGNVDVTASARQSFTLSNTAAGPIPVPAVSASGDFAASGSNCPVSLSAGASCSITVTFTPTATGTRTGTVSFNSAYTNAQVALTGNGIDFAVALSSTSGTVIAGRGLSFNFLATPIAGYASPVSLRCTTTAPGATCTYASGSMTPAAGATDSVTLTTTAQYTVIGYGGFGGEGLLVLLAGGSVWIFRRKLRRSQPLLKISLTVLLLSAASLTLTGCGDLKPAQNAGYTGPGSYTFTLTATDGILTHSTTYTLGVTQK